MMKRRIPLFAALLCLALLLGGCGKQTAVVPETTAAPTTTAPETEPSPLVLIDSGTPLCQVVRAEGATQAEIDAAIAIHAEIGRMAGKNAKITTDWIRPGGSYDESIIEILVGRTAQPASAAVYDTLGYGEIAIEVIGNKVVVAGWTAETIARAADELLPMLLALNKEAALSLPADYAMRKVVDEQINALPLYTGGLVDYIQPVGAPIGKTAAQITLKKTDLAAYEAYIAKLTAGGFTPVQENTIGENHFSTLTDGSSLITAYYMGLLGEARLIVEDDRAVCQPTEAYTPICDTTLWQMGLSKDNPDLDSSMNAYIVRLADGSFVLVDTGTTESAKYQIDYMRSLTPAGEKINIAAVIITHPHVDHVDGFLQMAERYRDQLSVRALYFNYGAFEMQSRYVRSTFERHWNDSMAAARRLGADAYIMRTGQRIAIADAVFEVLWTPEDFGTTIIEDYNNACVVTRMTVGDTVTLFLGDCRDKASPIIVNMYKNDLKCDLITVAHHGYGGSVTPLYEAAAAEIVFWPNLFFDEREVNRRLLAMDCVKAHYLAADGDVTVTLVDR